MLILLITHIAIAISGLIAAGGSLYSLSPKLIRVSHALTAGTITTGTALVFTTGDMLRGCLSGLLYLAVALGLTQIAQQKLAKQKI